MSKRILVAGALDRVGLWKAILAARRMGLWADRGLTVVLYHRVVGLDRLRGLDPELVDATPDEFDQQMAFLRRHFAPVSLDEVMDAAMLGTSLPPNAVLVSFDDGYRDNHEHALPVLLRYGMKAVFFVSTAYLTDRRLFWWEQVSLFVRNSTNEVLRLAYPDPIEIDLRAPGARAIAIRRLNRVIKDHHGLDLERFLGDLPAACGVAWSAAEERSRADDALMTWTEVRALADAGMAIGSHTRNHRVLQTVPPNDLDGELAGSRQEIEERLGRPVRSIAYPVGRAIAAEPAIRSALRHAGYELGFTTTPGINRFERADDLFDLKRLPIDRGTPPGAARTYLATPWLAR